MTEEMIESRISKLKALVARNNWAITDEAAREYVILEAKPSPTQAETDRKRKIIRQATGRGKCSCPHCRKPSGEETNP